MLITASRKATTLFSYCKATTQKKKPQQNNKTLTFHTP